MKAATRRLLEEQIAAVVIPGRGERNDAMWHVPHMVRSLRFLAMPRTLLYTAGTGHHGQG